MADQDVSDDLKILAACQDDQDEWLDALLAKADFSIGYTDTNGNSALHYAAQNGSLTCLEMLVRIPGLAINGKNKEGNTALHAAVLYPEDRVVALDMVNVLLDAGANPRVENKQGESPLSLVDDVNEEDMKDLLQSAAIDGALSDNAFSDGDDMGE
ncbi:ankyrin repeat-containing domain protein [Gongronella butleri]|nr:ankyrin repeat-containing domain protein [Gongronella butleri]